VLAEVDADTVTAAWVRNASDERALANGCRFDPERGAFTVWWIERHCRLYEGAAGDPLELRGCHECGTYDLPAATEIDDWEEAKASALERAERYAACVAAGHRIDWQYECTMRLFGWVRWSEKWQREVRRFRAASVWVAKKNKKSPTLAAWGFYLLAGDGEPGQKVFLGAKDGMQARKIAGEHIVAMLEQSEALSAECTLNRNTMRVTHRPTRSWLEPLSSSNSRTQESKEGLNGSVLIDEVHVVDRDFVRRIDRAGISRSEPLHIEVSTAGNNPDSYGKERFDYALRVERGDTEDQALFVAIYAAPQDLTDADLDADPEKFGQMANPAWGHTVDPEEFLADYRKSKRSIGALLDFKMYRLNIHQRTSNPWIKGADWEKCRRQFTIEDLRGRACWAGLDLARSRDMTALVFVFPWPEDGDEVFRVLPFFWLPKERITDIQSQVPDIRSWVENGHLEATDGAVTDYGHIRGKFRELHETFDIRELAYDPKFAEETTQTIEQGVTDNAHKVIEPGTGVPRFVFLQDDASFAAPTLDFERLVAAGKLHHNGHPVLNWQVGHAHVWQKPSKVKRVVKPSRSASDVRTVDGVVGCIMALGRAMLRPAVVNWYTPGCLTG
jgi:phage terminase large subunit-like protein